MAWAESTYWWLTEVVMAAGSQPVDGTQPAGQPKHHHLVPNSCVVTTSKASLLAALTSPISLGTPPPRRWDLPTRRPWVHVFECGERVQTCRMHTVLPRCACDSKPSSSICLLCLPIPDTLPSLVVSHPLASQLTGLSFGSLSRRSNGCLGQPCNLDSSSVLCSQWHDGRHGL